MADREGFKNSRFLLHLNFRPFALITRPPVFISLPDLFNHTLTLPYCLTPTGKMISRGDFFAEALALSQQLPAQAYAINICQDRYLFMVAYMAALFAGQITLLPANQARQTLADLFNAYPSSYCLTDTVPTLQPYFLIHANALTRSTHTLPLINPQCITSISFTSGSTGTPKAIAKTWAEFAGAAKLALQALDLQNKALILVSTVPAQHMYGLETSLFWGLFSQLIIYNARPFYPQDIRLTLQTLPDSLLVSTPLHLKTCTQTAADWGNVQLVLSSTAPLTCALAAQIEQHFQAPLFELYGSTETLSFASRRLTQQPAWQPYPTVQINVQEGQFFVSNGHLPSPVALDDSFEINALGQFKQLGRVTDNIKIAGKRASLTQLNQLLIQLPHVEDGVFFKTKHERLAALIVGNANKQDILTALKHNIDAVFLPKQIYRVPTLPRNAIGKLMQADLDRLIREVTDEKH